MGEALAASKPGNTARVVSKVLGFARRIAPPVAIAAEKHPGDTDDEHDDSEEEATSANFQPPTLRKPAKNRTHSRKKKPLFTAIPAVWRTKLVRSANDMRIVAITCAA